MAERSMFYTTTGSGNATAYTESQVAQWLQSTFTQDTTLGVLRDYLNELEPTVSGGNIAVNTGAAYVKGYWYLNDASKTVTVTTPSVGTTGYRVVLRITFASDTVTAVLISSSDGVSSIPALTQDGTTWEESLCSFTKTTGGVVTLTDTRVFAQYATNHVKRDGDTMLGDLIITNAGPRVRLVETDASANNQLWEMIGLGAGSFAIRAGNDAADSYVNAMLVSRNANDITAVNFPVDIGELQRNGSMVVDVGAMNRQGGSSSDFSTAGTTNYTLGNIRIQFGVTSVSGGGTVTFPVAFSDKPVVIVSPTGASGSVNAVVKTNSVTTTGFDLFATVAVTPWIAIGPA